MDFLGEGRYHSKGISFQRRHISWVPIVDIVWLKGPEVHQLCLILPDGWKPWKTGSPACSKHCQATESECFFMVPQSSSAPDIVWLQLQLLLFLASANFFCQDPETWGVLTKLQPNSCLVLIKAFGRRPAGSVQMTITFLIFNHWLRLVGIIGC